MTLRVLSNEVCRVLLSGEAGVLEFSLCWAVLCVAFPFCIAFSMVCLSRYRLRLPGGK